LTSFSREFPDVDWYTCRIPGIATALRNIDRKTVLAANGDEGSSHTAGPSAIFIGGAGMVAAGPWTLDGSILTSAGSHIRHGAGHVNDYIRLVSGHAGSDRTVRHRVHPTAPEAFGYAVPALSNATAIQTRFQGGRMLIPFFPHDRSNLAEVMLTFSVSTTGRTAFPNFAKFRVVRVDTSGIVQALHTARNGLYRDDGFLDVPASIANIAAFENGGATQSSNVYETNIYSFVELDKYAYFVDFIEESSAAATGASFATAVGTDYGTVIRALRVRYNQITSLRFQ